MAPKLLFKKDGKLGVKRFKVNKVVLQLEVELKTKDEQNALLKKDNEKMSKKVVEIEKSLMENLAIEEANKNEIRTQKEMIENLVTESRKRELDIKRDMDLMRRTNAEKIRDKNNEFQNLKVKFDRCKEKSKWMKDEADSLRETSKKRKVEMDDRSCYIEKLENYIEYLNGKLRSVEEDYATKCAEFENKEKWLEEFKKEMERKAETFDQCGRENRTLETENNELIVRMKVLEGSFTREKKERERLKRVVDSVMVDLEFYKSRGDELRKKNEAMKKRMEAIESELSQTQSGAAEN